MLSADVPPVAAPAAQEVVLARRDGNEVVATQDLPLVLVKAGRREDALVRQALFIAASVTLASQPTMSPPVVSYRWTHQAYLQRQVCFTSISGLFSCTDAQAEPLSDKASGVAPAGDALDAFPLADADLKRLTDQLRQRSATVFRADRRANIDPVFKAAGVAASAPARSR